MRDGFWVWRQNLGHEWRRLFDFAAQHGVEFVAMFAGCKPYLDTYAQGRPPDPAPRQWPPNCEVLYGEALKEISDYAHAAGVKLVAGFGLNGYHETWHVRGAFPETAAVIPQHLQVDPHRRLSLANMICPSHPATQEKIRELLAQMADHTGIDGFTFECGEVDRVTCQCPLCRERLGTASDQGVMGKSPRWVLEQVNDAVAFVAGRWPHLECRWAGIHQQNTDPARVTRELDPRCELEWNGMETAPDLGVCRDLARWKVGRSAYLLRLSETTGPSPRTDLAGVLEFVRGFSQLQPDSLVARSWLPEPSIAGHMAGFAAAVKNPGISLDALEQIARRATEAAGSVG